MRPSHEPLSIPGVKTGPRRMDSPSSAKGSWQPTRRYQSSSCRSLRDIFSSACPPPADASSELEETGAVGDADGARGENERRRGERASRRGSEAEVEGKERCEL